MNNGERKCSSCHCQLAHSVCRRVSGIDYCCDCVAERSLDERRNAIEFEEHVPEDFEPDGQRRFRTVVAIVFVSVSIALSFALMILHLSPFRLVEGVYGFAIVLVMGLVVTPVVVWKVNRSSKLMSVAYPQDVVLLNGYLRYRCGTEEKSAPIATTYYWIDEERIWWPQFRSLQGPPFYLLAGKEVLACGATPEARDEWVRVIQLCGLRRFPTLTGVYRGSVAMIVCTCIGKVGGALIDINERFDVFGGFIGMCVGFVVFRFVGPRLKGSRHGNTALMVL